MARRKKPQIKGTDPSYDHSFERFRPIPNDMPPDVVVPGVSKDDKSVEEAQKPKPPKEKTEQTKAVREKTKKAPKALVKPSKEKTPVVVPVSDKSDEEAEYRQTTLDAAVKTEQAKAMAALEAKGLKMKDIVTLAGRRATEQFILSSTFVQKPDGQRLPMKQGYHTSKRLPGKILDKMRQEQDPLGISSDPAMVRGQFELLFWECLDAVISELKKKY